jgi:hypothetical protein
VAGLLIWQGVLARYDYGVYKVLGCSSWWIYSAAAAGAGSLLRRGGAAAIYAGFALLLTAIGAEKWEDRRFRVWNSFYSLEPVRELDGVDRVIGPAPILFEVTDDMDYMWASVYLRRHPLLTTKLHGYYIFTSVKMRGPALEDCHYRLVSGDQPEAVWHNARFSLLPIAVAKLDQIENPNGLETVGNQSFFWLSSRPTTITIYAPAAGEYELAASAFQAGASVAPGSQCPIEVEDPAGRRVFVPTLGQHAPGIPLHLDRGENRVTLRGLSRATILSQPNGDTRELLLGVLGPRLQSRVSAAPSPAP